MNNLKKLTQNVKDGKYSNIFTRLYEENQAKTQPKRIEELATLYFEKYGEPENPPRIFSAPGRTEVGGNHTDHQHGRVLAAAINLDAIAIAAKTNDNIVKIQSKGFNEDIVDLGSLAFKEDEIGRAISLVRGVCGRFVQLGYKVGGFNAYTTSDVPLASGLSSSAAFENLIATTLNHLYNNGEIDSITIAQICQYAENEYYGKPSGLLDQGTSSVGGFITIDFADPKAPIVQEVDFDFSTSNHALCIVTTGGDHSDLTDEYAAVANEMRDVAKYMGKNYLREVSEADFYAQLGDIRKNTSDRAVVRAMHFFSDNSRVVNQVEALQSGDFPSFKQMVIDSGHSSFMFLQNVYTNNHPLEQGLSVALAVSENLLKPVGGAWRVHGGGFAGTIQAFVPLTFLTEYISTMDSIFGSGSCHQLIVRPLGGTEITEN